MTYTHHSHKEQAIKDSIKEKLANLRRLQSAIFAEELAKEQHLTRLYNERRRRQRAGDYTPSAEALAYRDKYADIIAQQPAPIHGGAIGLRRAAAEIEEYDLRKRAAA